MLQMDAEKEKYSNLLSKHSSVEQQFEALSLHFEGKEQECLTL